MKNFYSLLLVLLLINFINYVYAQKGNNDLEYRKWRITFIPPLSTNGIDAPKYTSRRSVNLIGGYHGGLDG